MSDAIETVRGIITGTPAITAIIGTRVSATVQSQDTLKPSVILSLEQSPVENMSGAPTLYSNTVTAVAVSEISSTEAAQIADLIRDAVAAAGHAFLSKSEAFDPDVTPPLYVATAQFQVWTNT